MSNDNVWIPYGDFTPLTNTRDVVHVSTVKVLWYVASVVHMIAYVVSLYMFYELYWKWKKIGNSKASVLANSFATFNAPAKLVDKQPSQPSASVDGGKDIQEEAKKYNLKAVFLSVLFGNWCSSFFIALSFLKVSDLNTRNVGIDVTTTVIFVLGSCCFWFFAAVGAYLMVRIAIANAKMKTSEWRERIVKMKRVYLPVFCFLGMIADVVILFNLIDSKNEALFQGTVTVYYLMTGVSDIVVYYCVAGVFLIPLTKDLKQVIKANESQTVPAVERSTTAMKKILKKSQLFVIMLTGKY